MGQATGTAGEQALQNSAAAGEPPKEEKGFFGRLFDSINPFSDDSGPVVAQPPTPAADASQPQAATPPAPEQSPSQSPPPSGK